MNRRDLILGTISDLVVSLMAYDRQSDEDLPLGSIEEAIASGEVTIAEMIHEFSFVLQDILSTSLPKTTPGSPGSTTAPSSGASGVSPEHGNDRAGE